MTEETQKEEIVEESPKADYSLNWLVFWVLIIATIGEFVLGYYGATQLFALMMVIALIKTGFIVSNYMNIGRLFSGDEENH